MVNNERIKIIKNKLGKISIVLVSIYWKHVRRVDDFLKILGVVEV